MSTKKILINYTNRDFHSIKKDLEEHAKVYYPDTYRDFGENSFGSYVLDAVSYVGDMLSFYLDYQVNESFLDTSVEYDNVRRHAKQFGYKFQGRPPAFGLAAFYVRVPANTSGLGPDFQYIPILRTGSEMSSTAGTSFVLTEDVDFNNEKNEVVASRFSETTGKPTEYAIRAYGLVKSTVLYRTTVETGPYTRFRRVAVGPSSISEIKSVVDSEGHVYYEVDHLSQDVVYVETTNPSARADGVRSIMKPRVVPRRFVVVQDSTGTYLQFGYGSDEESSTTDITDPSQIALKMSGKPYITDNAFDPTKLLDTNTLGVVPSNTTLTIHFYKNTTDSVNVNAGELSSVDRSLFSFPNADENSLITSKNAVRNSIEVANDRPIAGNTSMPSAEEVKYRSYAAYASQQRAVTKNDYEAYCYMMPAKFGSVKRASVVNDPSATNRKMSLYVIGEDNSGNLTTLNSTIKDNLKVWLNKNKMINDSIDVYDAKILNIGFDYEIIVDPTKDKLEVLNAVQRRLGSELLQQKMYIGEPFYITKVYNIINKVKGVVDTKNVTMRLMRGSRYSSAPVSILEMQSADGTYLKTPRNVILEIKRPNSDIRGTAQ